MNYTLAIRFQKGHIIVLALVFAGIFMTVGTALAGQVTAYSRLQYTVVAGAQALAIAEGALDNAVDRLNGDPSYTGEIGTPLGNGEFSVAVAAIDTRTKRVTATGYVPNRQNPLSTRTIEANVAIRNDVISFNYGIQAGNGGFFMDNSSKVIGNVFSSGSVIGTSQNYVYGDVISAGPTGLVYGIHATSSVYAHTIGHASESTLIDRNAYYDSLKVNTSVGGTSYPNSPDQPVVPLPISDEQIAEWEAAAEAGGTAVCSSGKYEISSETADLGPVKIPCDLDVSGTSVVTVHGPLWVVGNIIVQNSSVVKMSPSLGGDNVAIIADDPSDRLQGSKIFVKNTATFEDSGTPGSFVFLISQNNSAENGGSEEAFSLSNSASALVAYAAHGLIPLENTVSLKEVTAYKIHLKNSASVTYDSGLPNVVFKTGPGGSWSFVPGTYAITR